MNATIKARLTRAAIVLLALINHQSLAQSFHLSGRVTDSSGAGMAYATVSLLQQHKSSRVLQSVYTGKAGDYQLTAPDTGSYQLVYSFAGYQEQVRPIHLNPANPALQLPDIILVSAAKTLQSVQVTARKRLVEIRDDGISYHAEADPMANSDKLIDLLRKIPMVTIDGNDQVEINGQSNFKVLLNGRETALFARNLKQALNSFPGNQVSRIDIITNPSSKYDAEGIAGIINIITRKKILGYTGSIGAEINTQQYKGANASLNVKFKKAGITALASTGKTAGLNYESEETIEAFNAIFYKRSAHGRVTQHNASPNINLELNYEPDSLNTVSLYGSLDRSWREDHVEKEFTLLPDAQGNPVQSNYNAVNKNKTPGWSAGLDYIRKFKRNKEQEFSIKLFSIFGNDNTRNSSEQLSDAGNRFVANESQASDRQYTLQADYLQPLWKKQKLELGSKLILRRASSNYESLLKYQAADPYRVNPQNSDKFSYKQSVYSVYSSYSYSLKKMNFRVGIRLEHTEVDGEFISSQTMVAQQYTNVIPNFLIATRLKNGHQVSFNYSLRLSRPYINYLNPFVDNTDSLSIRTGNPTLEPQVFHSSSLQYRFGTAKLFASFTLGNSYSTSYILYKYTLADNTGITTASFENNGISNRIYCNASVNANLSSKLTVNINSGAAYLSITSRDKQVQKNAGFTGNLGYNGTYRFTKKISGSNFFNYYFPVVLIQGTRNAYFAYGIGGRYNLLQEKLLVSVYLNNLFAKKGVFKRVSTFKEANFENRQTQYIPFRGLGIALTWTFGKLTEEVSKKRGVTNNDLL